MLGTFAMRSCARTTANEEAGVLPDLRFVVRFLDNLLNEAEHELRSRDLACKALFDDPSFLRNVDPSQAISL